MQENVKRMLSFVIVLTLITTLQTLAAFYLDSQVEDKAILSFFFYI